LNTDIQPRVMRLTSSSVRIGIENE
jgi:hypothetical protein